MSIEESINSMKKIQDFILKYIENDLDVEENYENLKNTFIDLKVTEDKHKLKLVLRLINKIGNNHRRVFNFFQKIEHILQGIKSEITKLFSNSEIFEIFHSNKRILLFFIKENLIKIDEYIFSEIVKDEYVNSKYPQYFSLEIRPFLTEEFVEKYSKKHFDCDWIEEVKKQLPDDFDQKRLEGENDNYICELIRKQKTKDFIAFMNRKGFSFDSFIPKSIYETNLFLLEQDEIEIIEYASFFGSMEIINVLIREKVELSSYLWEFSIHSENNELIQYLEENKISPIDFKYEITLKESIKCHHNDVAKYIINYLIREEDLEFDKENDFTNNLYRYSIEYDNYCFFPDNIKYKFIFHYLCGFDYYNLVNYYLANENIDINEVIISKLTN